jgi:hypothetical protein
MIRHLLREYWYGFRWKNVKERFAHFNEVWFLLYLLVIFPVLIRRDLDSFRNIAVFYGLIVPVVFLLFSLGLHPLAMKKIFYLCPMSETERNYFLRWNYRIRILMPCLLETLVVLLLIVIGRFHNGALLFELLLYVTLALTLSLDDFAYRSQVYAAKHAKRKWVVLGNITLLSLELYFMVDWLMSGQGSFLSWRGTPIFLVIYVFVNLPLTIRILHDRDTVLATYMFYEDGQKMTTERRLQAERQRGGIA